MFFPEKSAKPQLQKTGVNLVYQEGVSLSRIFQISVIFCIFRGSGKVSGLGLGLSGSGAGGLGALSGAMEGFEWLLQSGSMGLFTERLRRSQPQVQG